MKISELIKFLNRGLEFDFEVVERGLPFGFTDDSRYLTYEELESFIPRYNLDKYNVFDICHEDPFGLGHDALCIELVDNFEDSVFTASFICNRIERKMKS